MGGSGVPGCVIEETEEGLSLSRRSLRNRSKRPAQQQRADGCQATLTLAGCLSCGNERVLQRYARDELDSRGTYESFSPVSRFAP